jgi:hypothetical protein
VCCVTNGRHAAAGCELRVLTRNPFLSGCEELPNNLLGVSSKHHGQCSMGPVLRHPCSLLLRQRRVMLLSIPVRLMQQLVYEWAKAG